MRRTRIVQLELNGRCRYALKTSLFEDGRISRKRRGCEVHEICSSFWVLWRLQTRPHLVARPTLSGPYSHEMQIVTRVPKTSSGEVLLSFHFLSFELYNNPWCGCSVQFYVSSKRSTSYRIPLFILFASWKLRVEYKTTDMAISYKTGQEYPQAQRTI